MVALAPHSRSIQAGQALAHALKKAKPAPKYLCEGHVVTEQPFHAVATIRHTATACCALFIAAK